MYINKISNLSLNLGFKGYQHVKNDVGETIMKFNYPYDSENEICEVEIYRVEPNEKFNYKVTKQVKTIELTPNGKEVNLQREANLGKDETFAYRIIRRDKITKKEIWKGADTGVKMHPGKDGVHEFRVHLDEEWNKHTFNDINDDGTPKYENGKPVIRETGYNSTQEFKGQPISAYNYTLVKQNGTTPLVQGAGYLAMPDTYMPGMKYRGFDEDNTGEIYYDSEYQKHIEKMNKTFSNMYGGSMAGLEALVPYLKENGFKMMFTTPIANGDNRTSHGYWNKNNMQIAPNMGTTENYYSLMSKEFQNGLVHVFDATLTSEGIEGIRLGYALRWGEQAQSYRWFRLSGLKDNGIGFGVVPNNNKNLRHKLINAPFKFELQSDGTYKEVKNKKYNPNKETYMQIYDASQVTQEQVGSDEPIGMYQELNAGKELKINTFDDTIMNYVFEINPEQYKKNIDKINTLNKKDKKEIKLDTPEGTLIATTMPNFHISRVNEGYVAWDDNPDMIKMNHGISAYDEKELQAIADKAQRQYEQELRVRASKEVIDMDVQSGKYWAEQTQKAHTIYTLQTLRNAKSADKINELISEGKLPEEVKISQNVVDNILNGEYNLAPKGVLNKDDATIKALMKLPLDSLEFGDNTVGVLATSYFSNRATTDETIGVSRFDLMKQNNPHLVKEYANVYNRVNNMFTRELNDFAQAVIKKVNENSNTPLVDKDGNYTEYGEYVIEYLGADIAKYALLKSLAGDSFRVKILPNGQLTYDYDKIRKNTTLKSLGINASNATEEAEILQRKMLKGVRNLSENDIAKVAKAISKTIEGTDTDSFRLSEALVERSGLGLAFRLDAAKDMVDIDSVKNRDSDFDDTWTSLIKLWGHYVSGIKSVNPHAYIVAEMTDIADVMRITNGGPDSCPYNGWTNVNGVKYNGEPDAMTKFFNETGITSEAAYSYFFTELLTSFSREFERGENKCDTHDDYKHKYDLLINTRSADYLRNLYTFMGNHDKTRTAHGLAIDMNLFHSTLVYGGTEFHKNHSQRLDVIKVLSGITNDNDKNIPLELRLNVDNLDYFRTVSARAVAQTKLLMGSVDEDLKGIASDNDIKLIKEALIDLTNGNYKESKTTEKLTRINIKEISSIENAVNEIAKLAKKYGANLSDTDIKNLIENVNNLNFDNYLVHGDFDHNELGETNKQYLREIIGGTDNPMDYSLYTVQIARMIKKAAEGNSYANAINFALSDFVKEYNRDKISQNMDAFKMFEDPIISRKKNGYASKDFRTAMELALAQAEFKSGKTINNKEEIINTVYRSVTEPAIHKHAMILAFLSSFCGISTLYAGDEYGLTGYEDKTKNINLQNRLAIMFSEIKNSDSKIGAIQRTYKDYTLNAMRAKANVKPIKNGTPYTMDVQVEGKNRDQMKAAIAELNEKIKTVTKNPTLKAELEAEKARLQNEVAKTAFMIQGADGDMAISIFNAGGISHENRVNYFKKFKKYTKAEQEQFLKDNNIDSLNPNNPYIPIQERSELDAILMGAGVTIPLGTIFYNTELKDKAEYIVDKIDGKLAIVKKGGGKIVMDGKTAKYGVMTLRKAFRGRQHNISHLNKQYNIVTNPYENLKNEFEIVKSKHNHILNIDL